MKFIKKLAKFFVLSVVVICLASCGTNVKENSVLPIESAEEVSIFMNGCSYHMAVFHPKDTFTEDSLEVINTAEVTKAQSETGEEYFLIEILTEDGSHEIAVVEISGDIYLIDEEDVWYSCGSELEEMLKNWKESAEAACG